MNRQYLFVIAVFLVLAGATGAVYQFYFKVRLEGYAENRDTLDKNETLLKKIQNTFSDTKPDVVVKLWSGAVIPWDTALEQRTAFFNLKNAYQTPPIPQGQTPRFYYEKQANHLRDQIYADSIARNPPCRLPPIVYAYFGAPQMSQLTGRDVSRQDVQDWLHRIRVGCEVTRLLLDAGAVDISDINLWPKRMQGSLEMQTAGVAFMMNAESLFKFLDKIRESDRFIEVNALRISNAHLRWYPDPYLNVEMLITQARYIQPRANQGAGAATAAQPASTIPGAPGTPPNIQKLLVGMRGTPASGASGAAAASQGTEQKSWWQYLWPF